MADPSLNEEQALPKASAGTIAKATARAVGGDVYSAVLAVIKDEQLRKTIICAIVLFSFLLVGMLTLVGSAIIGAAESICNTWSENYDEAWINAGINSSGSAIYMFLSSTYEGVFTEAMSQTINDVFRSVTGHTVDGEDATNSDATSFGEVDTYTAEDAQITLQSITDEEALTGANGAIMRRLDMIKKRVQQRGYQIEKSARAYYGLRSYGYAIALWLQNSLANPFLFRGYDESSSGVTIDTSAFQLTDLQALKILCAFSVQYNSDISDVDMWSLMDYCGWYDVRLTELPAPELDVDSIYEDAAATAVITSGLEGVIASGTDISHLMSNGADATGDYVIQFGSLPVPYWRGSFVPQWVVEERALIKQHNENYWRLLEAGATISDENQKWGTQATADSEITGFQKLDAVEEYGLIDKIFKTTEASMSVSAHSIETHTGIIDSILNSIPASFHNAWYTAFPEQEPSEYTDTNGNYITTTSITYYNAEPGEYVISRSNSSSTLSRKTIYGDNPQTLRFSGLTPETTYKISKKISTPTAVTWQHIYTFTTTAEPIVYQAQSYKISVNVNISFAALSIDDLIYNTIGLWTGSLLDVTETESGIYQAGQEDNNLLLYEWTDTYIDDSGTPHEITFTRQQGYQAEAYRDAVSALADAVGIETNDLYNLGTSWQGQDIVSVALAEIESYSGTGGAKYWNAYMDYTGGYASTSWPWCCCFVWYCGLQCGYLSHDGSGCFGSTWQVGCPTAFEVMRQSLNAVPHTSSSYMPIPGDLVFFGDFDHIGIVVEVMDDGSMLVAEGNHSNKCKLTVNANYRVGSYAVCGYPICAYITPDYPATTSTSNDWLYTQIPGNCQPNDFASNIGTNTTPVLKAGQFRMTRQQITAFGKWMNQQDSELLETPEAIAFIQAAAETIDTDSLILAWNTLAISCEDEFKSMQTQYAEEAIALPVAKRIYTQSGFNWTSSTTRLEVLWAIVTATQNTQSAVQVLTAITSGLRDNATDSQVRQAVQERMQSVIDKYAASLWFGYPEELIADWKETFRMFAESFKGGDCEMADIGSGGYRTMSSSQELVDLIKVCEGFSATAYWDYAQWTIGYGTRADSSSQVVTPAQAEKMLKSFLKTFEGYVNSFCKSIGKQPTQGQFDALVSFTYNLGPAWTTNPNHKLVQQLKNPTNEIDFVNVLGQYCHAGGEVLYPLTQRRILEAIMYMKGEYYIPWKATPASDYNLKTNLPVASFGALPYYSVVIYQYDYSTSTIAKGMGHEVHYYPVGDSYGALPNPSRAGYIFNGWKITRINNNRTTSGRILTSGTKVESALEATAIWTR